MMCEAPPLVEFFKAVLDELRKRLNPENFDVLIKECEVDPGEEKTYHDQRNG